jgi:hypothetical protein
MLASRNLLKGRYLVEALEFQSSSNCLRSWARETGPDGIIRFGRSILAPRNRSNAILVFAFENQRANLFYVPDEHSLRASWAEVGAGSEGEWLEPEREQLTDLPTSLGLS